VSRAVWRAGKRASCALCAIAPLLTACSGPASTLDPQGARAAEEARLWWVMFGLGTLVYVAVLGLLFYALFRSRRATAGEERDVVNSSLVIVGGGIVLPLLILPIIWVLTLQSMAQLAAPPTPTSLTVEVVGHQWWYEVRYPAQGLTLANEMRIPSGTPVQLQVSSEDVIHSFWVPRLMGKIDMVPGRINERWVEAAQPGSYLVECAEFCGLWHARMQMTIVAVDPAEFTSWLASQTPRS
jgi:cytochrome c oxidase subunit 2